MKKLLMIVSSNTWCQTQIIWHCNPVIKEPYDANHLRWKTFAVVICRKTTVYVKSFVVYLISFFVDDKDPQKFFH